MMTMTRIYSRTSFVFPTATSKNPKKKIHFRNPKPAPTKFDGFRIPNHLSSAGQIFELHKSFPRFWRLSLSNKSSPANRTSKRLGALTKWTAPLASTTRRPPRNGQTNPPAIHHRDPLSFHAMRQQTFNPNRVDNNVPDNKSQT